MVNQQIVKNVPPMVLWAPQALPCLRNPLMWLDICGLLYCHVAHVGLGFRFRSYVVWKTSCI